MNKYLKLKSSLTLLLKIITTLKLKSFTTLKLKYRQLKIALSRKLISSELKRIKWYLTDIDYTHNRYLMDMCRIHQIRIAKSNRNRIIVKIKLSRPGIFIGKQGSNIDKLQKDLSDYLDKKVIFNLIEYDPLSTLFF